MPNNIVVSSKEIKVRDLISMTEPIYNDCTLSEYFKPVIKILAPNFYDETATYKLDNKTIYNFLLNVNLEDISKLVLTDENIYDYLLCYKFLTFVHIDDSDFNVKRVFIDNNLENKIFSFYWRNQSKIDDAYYFLYKRYYEKCLNNLEKVKKSEKLYILTYQNNGIYYPYLVKDSHYGIIVYNDCNMALDALSKVNSQQSTIKIMTFSFDEFRNYLIGLRPYGIKNISFYVIIDSKFNHFNFSREDVIVSNEVITDYFDSKVNLAILYNFQSIITTNKTQFPFIYYMMKDSLFFVPVCYDGDDKNVEDYSLHTTINAGKEIASIEEKLLEASNLGFSCDKILGGFVNKYFVVDAKNQNDINQDGNKLFEKYIYENEKYCLNENKENNGKIMHRISVKHQNEAFMPAFTSIDYLKKVFGNNVRVAIYTFNEIIENLNDKVLDDEASNIVGIVLNPSVHNIVYSKNYIENEKNAEMKYLASIQGDALQNKAKPLKREEIIAPDDYQGNYSQEYKKLCQMGGLHLFIAVFCVILIILCFIAPEVWYICFLFLFVGITQIPTGLRALKKYSGKINEKIEKADYISTNIRMIYNIVFAIACLILILKSGPVALLGTVIFLVFAYLEYLRIKRIRFINQKAKRYPKYLEELSNEVIGRFFAAIDKKIDSMKLSKKIRRIEKPLKNKKL